MTELYYAYAGEGGFAIEPRERFESSQRSIQVLRSARSLAELQAAELAGWARGVVEAAIEHRRDDEIDDDGWVWREESEWIIDRVPLPWDAANLREWMPAETLQAHAKVGGASPGGHIDGYEVDDPDALLEELARQGYTLTEYPELVDAYYRAL